MDAQSDRFDHLDAGGRGVARLSRRPRALIYATIGAATLLAWLMLFGMAREAAVLGLPGSAAAGDELLRRLPSLPIPNVVSWLAELCLTPKPSAGTSLAALTVMWMLMSVAMMLPSASPMIRTYCEIADTAAAKGERAIHPLVLLTGYLFVWFIAALGFAVLTMAALKLGGGEVLQPATAWVAAAALLLAGAYQLSSFKHACLKKCRNPFAILFARWTTSASGIFRLGAEQGVWCLGCCWALMLVMFAVGIMNVFWMALIGLFTLVEKETAGRFPSAIGGAILLVWGVTLILVSA